MGFKWDLSGILWWLNHPPFGDFDDFIFIFSETAATTGAERQAMFVLGFHHPQIFARQIRFGNDSTWLTGWWFGCHQFYFPRNLGNNHVVWLPSILFSQKSWECHHPNWRSHIFQRGGEKPPSSVKMAGLWMFATKIVEDIWGKKHFLVLLMENGDGRLQRGSFWNQQTCQSDIYQ